MSLLAAVLTQGMPVAHMHRSSSLEIGQTERHSPIAPIGSSKQREERLVLIDGQQLAITERPPFGREIETDDLDFAQKWFRHRGSSFRCALVRPEPHPLTRRTPTGFV